LIRAPNTTLDDKMVKDCPIAKHIKGIDEDDLNKSDYINTSLLIFLARKSIEQTTQYQKDQQEMSNQIKNHTLNVQTLTSTLRDLEN
jgi:hypothetical protein